MTTRKEYHERLVAIIERIEEKPETWYQGAYHTECNTAHCIAGHAELDAIEAGEEYANDYGPHYTAWRWLGLNAVEAEYLFYSGRTWKEIKRFLLDKAEQLLGNELVEREWREEG